MRLHQVMTMRTERVEQDVAKSAEAFRTISEVAAELDVPQHVLRFWESKFSQIKPMKRAGGRRYYRPGDIDLLRGIRILLYSDGYTIKGVQKVLKEKGQRFVVDIGQSANSPGTADTSESVDVQTASDNRTALSEAADPSSATTNLHEDGITETDGGDQLPLIAPAPVGVAEPAANVAAAAASQAGISPDNRAAIENALTDLEAIARALRTLGD